MAAAALPKGRTLSLGDAAGRFWRHANPWIITVALLAALAVRLWYGRWTIHDLLTVVIVLALQSLTEWLIHVFILHFRPRRILGRRFDPLVARRHRMHHAEPWDEQLVFVPLPALAVTLIVPVGIGQLLATRGAGLTLIVVAYAVLFTYEWTHFLIHTHYTPRGRIYRYVWRAHRLHHFKNERYWYGVTMHFADHVLRTFPDHRSVPTSDTARTLGASG